MEIAPGIHRIKCTFEPNRVAFVHLLIGSEAAMLVDTCCAHNPEAEILPYMRSIGFDPKRLTYILISHSDLDHQGGNQPMKAAAPQALLMCHNLDRPWIESTEALIEKRYNQFAADHGIVMSEEAKQSMREQTLSAPLDLTLEGGECFRLSPDWYIEALHTPGHTWGHLAVFDPRSRTLIAGEAALSTAILDLDWKPAMPPTYCYVETYLNTIDRLSRMNIDIYAPSHWPVQHGSDVASFLRESRNYCLHVEAKLLELAQAGPFTLQGAIERYGRELGEWPESGAGALSFPFLANLNFLVQRGKLATSRGTDGVLRYSLPV
ncbi:MAG: MBL fold metallo-hydrolase [Aggregatilineales bacterium]